jgi:YD repeat-containing protein
VKTTAPDPDGILGSGQAAYTAYAYDALGQLVAETNGEGKVRSYAYDAQGNLIRA